MRASWWVTVLVVFGAASAVAGPYYDEDFSSDPGWVTDQPGNFDWNSTDEWYEVSVVNHHEAYQPSRYTYGQTSYPGGSFSLAWDMWMDRCDWSAGVNFGLYASDLQYQPHPVTLEPPISTVNLEYANPSEGQIFFLRATDDSGTSKMEKYLGVHYALETWYHNVIEYDALAGTVTATIRVRDSGTLVATLSLSGLGPFDSDMTRIGVTRYPFGETGYTGVDEWAVAEAWIDNVYMVPEPATLCMVGLLALALLRKASTR